MARLPVPGSDDGTWGDILNEFLGVLHNDDGTPKDTGVIAQKYVKPGSGIPESDLASAVQTKLNDNGLPSAWTVTNPDKVSDGASSLEFGDDKTTLTLKAETGQTSPLLALYAEDGTNGLRWRGTGLLFGEVTGDEEFAPSFIDAGGDNAQLWIQSKANTADGDGYVSLLSNLTEGAQISIKPVAGQSSSDPLILVPLVADQPGSTTVLRVNDGAGNPLIDMMAFDQNVAGQVSSYIYLSNDTYDTYLGLDLRDSGNDDGKNASIWAQSTSGYIAAIAAETGAGTRINIQASTAQVDSPFVVNNENGSSVYALGVDGTTTVGSAGAGASVIRLEPLSAERRVDLDGMISLGLQSDYVGGGYLNMWNDANTAPNAPSANGMRAFSRKNGSNKMEFCVRFPTGAVQVIATEP